MPFQSVNPATEQVVASYDVMTGDEARTVVASSDAVFRDWRETPFETRRALMKRAAAVLRERTGVYGELITTEMGKPIGDSRSEIEKCAGVCDFYAENGEAFLRSEPVETDASRSFVSFEPLGLVLAIMPWNFPFWQVFRFAAPALMAGNGALVKHAPNVTGSALAIEDVFRRAGFPEHLFRVLIIDVDVAAEVIENPLVRAVTLTGSTRAGKSVAAKAGEMLKKTVLELGGSDPYIILEDAHLESAVETCVNSRMINAGQSCISAKRFIVVESQRTRFETMFVERMGAFELGTPMDERSTLGPLARLDLRDNLHRQVEASISAGARCLLGGTIPDRKGAYYPPTVLTDVKAGMPAYEEELFGPVASIIVVANDDEAIAAANDSIYGLGAAVFTADAARGEQIAHKRIDAGSCFVNTFVRSDPRLPFGGIKDSGYGRELSRFGIREFVNVKTVYVK